MTSGAPVKPARWCSVLWRLAARSHLHEAWFKPRERLNEVALGGQCVQGQVEGVGFEVAAPDAIWNYFRPALSSVTQVELILALL